MGCTCDKMVKSVKLAKVGSHNGVEKPPWLTTEQIAVIRNNWQTLKLNIANVGVITFVGMFESRPELKELFVNFREKGLGEIQRSGLLRQHALRVMATVDKCITRIDEPDSFVTLLREVGVAHKQYKVPSEYIQIILPHFLAAIKPHIEAYWSDDMAEAWTQLFTLIVYHIEEGMANTERDKKTVSNNFTVT